MISCARTLKTDKNLIQTDPDRFVYNMEHDDIYKWIKQKREHFDLSYSVTDHMIENTNEKILRVQDNKIFTDSLYECPES